MEGGGADSYGVVVVVVGGGIVQRDFKEEVMPLWVCRLK